MKRRSVAAAILAGGAAKRMGGVIKSKILIDKKTILVRMMDVLGDIFDEIILVTVQPGEYEDLKGHRIVTDLFEKKGPLGGIHSALANTSKDSVFIFAGDMPFISGKIIQGQLSAFETSEYDVFVPLIGDKIEPLHSIYKVSVSDTLTNHLSEENDVSVRNFLKMLNVGYFQIEDNDENRLAFTNINTPGDLLSFTGQ